MGHGHNMNEKWDHTMHKEVTREIMRAVDFALIKNITIELRFPAYSFSRYVRGLESVLVSEKVIS